MADWGDSGKTRADEALKAEASPFRALEFRADEHHAGCGSQDQDLDRKKKREHRASVSLGSST